MADKKTIAALLVRIGMDDSNFKSKSKGVKTGVLDLKNTLGELKSALLGAFAVGSIVALGAESVKLAAKAEGVEEAFEKLDRPDLLNNLKAATRGTVSELELMQGAVQARNFKIPLEKLATYFEFATKRASETGEEVGRLVEQLVLGVGRQSVQRLDDLGLSMKEIQEEVKKVGDFGVAVGNIIERELVNMGDVSETTAQRLEQLQTAWKDIKTEIGEAIIKSYQFQETLDLLQYSTDGLDLIEEKLGGINFQWNIFNKQDIPQLLQGKWIEVAANKLSDYIKELYNLRKELTELETSFTGTDQAYVPKTGISGSLPEVYPIVPFSSGSNQDLLMEREMKLSKNEFGKMEKIYSKGLMTYREYLDEKERINSKSIVTQGSYYETMSQLMLEQMKVVESYALMIKQSFADMVSGLLDSLALLATGSKNVDFAGALLGPVAQVSGQLGRIVLVSGLGIEALKESLMTLTGAPAIAAGLGLLAISAGAKAAMKHLGNTGFTSSAATDTQNTPTSNVVRGYRSYEQTNIHISGEFRLRGNDLLAAIERAQTNARKIKG